MYLYALFCIWTMFSEISCIKGAAAKCDAGFHPYALFLVEVTTTDGVSATNEMPYWMPAGEIYVYISDTSDGWIDAHTSGLIEIGSDGVMK